MEILGSRLPAFNQRKSCAPTCATPSATRNSRATSSRSFKCVLGLSLSPVLALVITPDCRRSSRMLVPPGTLFFVLVRSRRRDPRLAFRRGQTTLTPPSTGPTRSVRVLASVFRTLGHCVRRFPCLCFYLRSARARLRRSRRSRSIPSSCDGLCGLVPSGLAITNVVMYDAHFASHFLRRSRLPPRTAPVVPRRRDSSTVLAVLDCRLFEAGVRVRRLALSQRRAARSRHHRFSSGSGHSSRCPTNSSPPLSPHLYRPRMRSAVSVSLSSSVPGPRCAAVDWTACASLIPPPSVRRLLCLTVACPRLAVISAKLCVAT
jgi:hypothetical protein